MTSQMLDRLHRWLGRSKLATRLALLLRNQCRAVIKYRLMTTHDVRDSGEAWLVAMLRPQLRTVVDVGANRGQWTRMLLDAAPSIERVVVIEPAPAAAAMLRTAFAADLRVTLVEAAVSHHEGEASFFEEGGAGEQSSLTRGASNPAAVERRVRLTTLDAELGRLQIDAVDLLKIDAEGSDLAVLRGAERLLHEQRAAVVQWEYSDVWALAGATLGAALDLLTTHGYDSFLLKSDGLYRFDYAAFGEFFTYANFVSFRRADAQRVSQVHELL